MNYEETLEYIHNIPKFNRILGNDLLKILLNKMGNPDDKLKFIHIGGTNGKGSISTMTAEILKEAGYKVGLFTSPYLEYFNERIRINGVPISDFELVKIVEYVRDISEKYNAKVSEFAFDTAVAIEYFMRNNCDFVVLEVGLGGKLDATNVVKAPVAIGFGSIGLDHCQYLGNTVDDISKDKFGIIKENSKVVLYPIQNDIVFENAKRFCEKQNAELIIPQLSNLIYTDNQDNTFLYNNEKFKLAMNGEFQIFNAITAIEIAGAIYKQGYTFEKKAIKKGLEIAKISGRFEYLSENLVIDGSHNPQAINALLNELGKKNKKIYFLTAVMQDKDYGEIVRLISDFAKNNNSVIFTTEIDMPRCLSCEELSKEFLKHNIKTEHIKQSYIALKKLQDKISDNQNALICVCGSLYLAGEIKRTIKI